MHPIDKDIISIRIPRTVADEVRLLAREDDENQSTILRRLIRLGLRAEHERRARVGAER